MNDYCVYQEVQFGDGKWASFYKELRTKYTLSVGMRFLLPGLWESSIESVVFDSGSDEMSVDLVVKKMPLIDRKGFDILQLQMAGEGWEFIEGRWGDDFLRAAATTESKRGSD